VAGAPRAGAVCVAAPRRTPGPVATERVACGRGACGRSRPPPRRGHRLRARAETDPEASILRLRLLSLGDEAS
jgi:hypothetical protein